MRLVQISPSAHSSVAKKRRKKFPIGRVFLMMTLLGATILYLRPIPTVTVQVKLPEAPAPSQVKLDWPTTGQAAISAEGYRFVTTNSAPQQVSTASMAKVIAALCVLEKMPLKPGESGPTLTMTKADVNRYERYVADNGSVLPISLGETMTEYKVLEAVLLPSANNMADSMVNWAFGSFENYKIYASDYLTRNGLANTKIGSDASGFESDTVSTTTDLAALGKLALKQPVLMEIVGKPSATFATAGTVNSTNSRVGQGVLTGLKTGHNDGNSGGFIFTARVTSTDDSTVTVVGSIVNDTSSQSAVLDAEQLALSMADDFETVVYPAGSVLGSVSSAWGTSSAVVTKDELSILRWKTNRTYYYDTLKDETDGTQTNLGNLYIKSDGAHDETIILAKQSLGKPSFWWRVSHIR